jgi:RNA polymerase sigma-70 factor (ECF subfamily)
MNSEKKGRETEPVEKMDMTTDPGREAARWAQEARAGNDEAFFRLMQAEKDRLYRIAMRHLGHEQDALDALQETAFRAYRGIRKLKEPAYARTWLVRIMLNVCNDALAKRGKTRPMPDADRMPAGPDAHERLLLEDAVSRLADPYRQVVMLKYFEDMTLRELALALDRPEGTVKTWLHKALEMLRGQLEKEGWTNG